MAIFARTGSVSCRLSQVIANQQIVGVPHSVVLVGNTVLSFPPAVAAAATAHSRINYRSDFPMAQALFHWLRSCIQEKHVVRLSVW